MPQISERELWATAPSLTTSPNSTQWPVLLLPIHLETRRIDDDLYIRAFPDQPFVNTHQESLSQDEHDTGLPLKELIKDLNAGAQNDRNDLLEKARGEWRELARRFGTNRAAWILKSLYKDPEFPVVDDQSMIIPQLFLLPERFVFMVYEDGQLAYCEAGAKISQDLTLLPSPTEENSEASPDDGLFDETSRWITDLEVAINVGLAVKIPLRIEHRWSDDLHFSEVVAIGLRAGGKDAGAQALEQFIQSHHYSDGFEFLPYGTPTNNTTTTSSGYSESEEALLASFDIEVLSPMQKVSDIRKPETASALFGSALGIDIATQDMGSLSKKFYTEGLFDHIKGADLIPNDGFSETLKAIWKPTGDYFFNTLLGYQKQYDFRAMLLQHSAEYLRPRGMLTAVRIGNLPYGILPASRMNAPVSDELSGWKPSLLDNQPDSQRETGLVFDKAIHNALNALLPLWLDQANNPSVVPRPGGSGDPDEEILRVLGMMPHSLSYRVRPVVDQVMIAWLLQLLGPTLFGATSSFGGLAEPAAAYGAWKNEKDLINKATVALLEKMGAIDRTKAFLLRMFAWGRGFELDMPLIRDPDSPEDGPEKYLPVLAQEDSETTPDVSKTLLYDLLFRSLQAGNWPSSLPSTKQLIEELSDYPVIAYFNNIVTQENIKTLAEKDLPGDLTEIANIDLLVNSLNQRSSSGYSRIEEIENKFAANSNNPQNLPLFNNLAGKLRAGFEDSLKAGLQDVIDALTYRLDAWYSSLPAKRLTAMRTRKPSGLLWGAYGYLEDISLPRKTTLRGRPETGGGYIHAPSVGQANAAAMLRSVFDTHRDDQDGNPYALNLTSNRVNRALALIDGIRQGQDLPVLLGYQFERGLHNEGLDRLIDDFRKVFSVAEPDDTDPDAPAEVVAPRNVCDGRALAEAFDNSFAENQEVARAIDTLGRNEKNALQGLLGELRDAMDAVGDLLLYEGVFQAAQGNYERSGSALDAGAGIGKPPEIESLETFVGGTNLRHRVCVLLPNVPNAIPDETQGPGARAAAEPRLNAWVGSLFGSLSAIGCRVFGTAGTNSDGEPVDVVLSDLVPAISPLDLIYMCDVLPTGTGNTEIELRIRQYAMSRWGAAEDAKIEISFEEAPVIDGGEARSLAHAMEVGRAVLDMLGNSTSLTPQALMHPEEAPGATSDPQPSYYPLGAIQDLRNRFDAARALLYKQAAILGSNDPGAESCELEAAQELNNPSVAIQALNVCAGFGIEEALVESSDDPDLNQRRLQVFEIVKKRIAGADALLATATADTEASVQPLREAMKQLFGEKFVVLPEFAAPANDTRFAAFNSSTIQPPPSEDRIWLWLQQVAETHPRVRVLETLLMVAEAWGTLRSGTSPMGLEVAQLPSSGQYDWQALADAELRGSAGRVRGCQSIVAMVPETFPEEAIAGFVIDEWTETVPDSTVTTGISFEYNQPSQQAPQCLLLAIPGDLEEPTWTVEHLAGIVRDTMNLAKVRLVDLDALPQVAGIFPALLFPINPTGASTDPSSSSVYGIPSTSTFSGGQ